MTSDEMSDGDDPS